VSTEFLTVHKLQNTDFNFQSKRIQPGRVSTQSGTKTPKIALKDPHPPTPSSAARVSPEATSGARPARPRREKGSRSAKRSLLLPLPLWERAGVRGSQCVPC
jgi:hypothetical protein